MFGLFRSSRVDVSVQLLPSEFEKVLRQGSCVLLLPVPAWETAPKRGSVSVTLGRPDQVDIPKECRVPVHGVLPVEFTANLKPGHYLPELVVALGPDEWGTMILLERPFEVVSKTATRIELSCAPKYAPGS